jgi:nucleotide-binding universal stress UspA family protein
MQLIEKILLPIGFEQKAEILLDNVTRIAKNFKSEVILLHVLPNHIEDSSLKGRVEEKLIEYSSIIQKNNIECSYQIKTGKAVDKVIETSEKEDVNMIVVGSGDVRKNIYRLGSTSEKIIRNSEIPVWVVEKESSGKIAKVVCPIDFSDQSKIALDNAIHISRIYDAQLTILSVVKSHSKEYESIGVKVDNIENTFEKELYPEFEKFLEGFKLSDIQWTKEIKFGNPADEIINYILENDVDVAVMGSTGKTRFSRILIGSVTEKVSRKVPCSMVITKSESLIQLKIENELKDIDKLFQEGVELHKNKFIKEAIEIWIKCTSLNEFYLKAWSSISNAYAELGDKENAKKYADIKERIQRSIWDKQVEADLRGRHEMF